MNLIRESNTFFLYYSRLASQFVILGIVSSIMCVHICFRHDLHDCVISITGTIASSLIKSRQRIRDLINNSCVRRQEGSRDRDVYFIHSSTSRVVQRDLKTYISRYTIKDRIFVHTREKTRCAYNGSTISRNTFTIQGLIIIRYSRVSDASLRYYDR